MVKTVVNGPSQEAEAKRLGLQEDSIESAQEDDVISRSTDDTAKGLDHLTHRLELSGAVCIELGGRSTALIRWKSSSVMTAIGKLISFANMTA